MSFQTDLHDGKEIEKQFLAHLIKQGVKVRLNTATTLTEQRFYDVFTSDGVLYEIKFDKLWSKTGNVYVEKKSLGTSKADFTVYKLEGREGFFQIDTNYLRTILPNYSPIKGGDKKEDGVLIPVAEFEREFTFLSGG